MPDPRLIVNLLSDRLAALPLAIVYLTDRCDSRCITCDYWRTGQTHMTAESAERIAAQLPALGTRMVLLSGGEPLLHPQWDTLAAAFRARVDALALLTSGIRLPKHGARVRELCTHTIVSLDAATAQTYRQIRGVDGFATVERGVRALAEAGGVVSVRCTVQRGNYRELPQIARCARDWGARAVSFLAVDVSARAAFGRNDDFGRDAALAPDDLPRFDAVLDAMDAECAADFASGFIAESPQKLRRLRQYFAALHGEGAFPPVQCNAPRWSAVFEPDGALKPCYFLPAWGTLREGALADALNDPAAQALRRAQRAGERPECERCVCSAYRGARVLLRGDLLS